MQVSGWLTLMIAFGAACMDVWKEKVENRFLVCGWLLGLGYQLGVRQSQGIFYFLAGAVLPVLLLWVLFLFRMLGPGDIKLMSVLGGIMGAETVLFCIFYSFILGAILSLAFLITCGNFLQRFSYFSDYISTFLKTKKRVPYYFTGARPENIHFTVPVLMGVMLYAGGFY